MAIFLGFLAPDASTNEYPNPGLLIEAADLAEADIAKESVVLDGRSRANYEQGHIPGARWVDHAAWSAGFGDSDDAEGWSKRIGGLGVEQASKVVIYDDGPSKDAARIWWILRYWGVADARLFNGGMTGWKVRQVPNGNQGPIARSSRNYGHVSGGSTCDQGSTPWSAQGTVAPNR